MNKIIVYGLLFFGLLLSLELCAQNNTGTIVQASFQKMNGGQVDEAISDLMKFIETEPDHAGALGMLGLGYRRKGDHGQSLVFYQQAATLQPKNMQSLFNLGVAYALAEDNDMAFETLLKVKASNVYNITNVGLSPAGTLLKDDKRYRQLFPSAEAYADPFVEDGAKVIHDWAGENQSDQFGWIGRNIGDVNGDGIMDITSSAPTNNEGAANAGKIYVHSGKTGELLWSYAAKEEKGQLGMSIEAAGDVNGDGTPDVVAGAPYVNKTWVFSGTDGKPLYEWSGEHVQGAFGRGVRGVGDVNKDGYDDVLIGEPFQIWGGPINGSKIEQAGSVYLYSGKDGTILQEWGGEQVGDGFGTALSGKTTDGKTLLMIGAPGAGPNKSGRAYVYKGMNKSPFFTIQSDTTGARLGGMFMSIVGDVNGDGRQDVYASDFANSALGRSTGRAYVYSGADGKPLHVLTGESAGDGFGIGVADAGDIDKDGYDDLVIGAWQHASAAPSGGKIYVYSGKDGSLMRTLTGKIVGETLGFDTTGIGDVNGDGIVDLLLTSAWSGINGSQSGRMMVIAGK